MNNQKYSAIPWTSWSGIWDLIQPNSVAMWSYDYEQKNAYTYLGAWTAEAWGSVLARCLRGAFGVALRQQ